MPKTPTETKRARAELRDLKRAEAKVARDGLNYSRHSDRLKLDILKAAQNQCAALDRDATKAGRAVDKQLNRIHTRIQILEGRLS